MTKALTNPAPLQRKHSELPACYQPIIENASADARQMKELGKVVWDLFLEMEQKPVEQWDRDRLGAMICIMTDMAEALEWKLDRIMEQPYSARPQS